MTDGRVPTARRRQNGHRPQFPCPEKTREPLRYIFFYVVIDRYNS